MTASDLAVVVRPSELVPSSQLLDAYESLATRGEAADFGASSVFRGPLWETTKSPNYQPTQDEIRWELLECKPMQTGKHRWSIEVTSSGSNVWIGLACICSGVIPRKVQHYWAWHKGGSKFEGKAALKVVPGALPTFEQGDTLTFTLDLTRPISLTVLVNGEHEFAGSDHKALTPVGGGPYSFVPALRLCIASAARFSGFLPI